MTAYAFWHDCVLCHPHPHNRAFTLLDRAYIGVVTSERIKVEKSEYRQSITVYAVTVSLVRRPERFHFQS